MNATLSFSRMAYLASSDLGTTRGLKALFWFQVPKASALTDARGLAARLPAAGKGSSST